MRGELRPNCMHPAARGRWIAARTIGLVAMCLLVSSAGCTPWREYFSNGLKVGPNYSRPPAAVAQKWIEEGDERISTADADISHWWTVFNDDELNQLVEAAYQQNLTLREAGFRILQARAALAVQVGNLFPQSQEAMGLWTRNSSSLLAANMQFLPEQFYDNWDLGFNLAWELDFWGRFRRAIIAAEDTLEASVYEYDDVIVTLLGDVASTYVFIRTTQQKLAYVHQNVAIQQESLDIAKARYAGGLTSDLDVEQAISQLAQTKALIPRFEFELRLANNRLCVLLGIPSEDLVKLMGEAPIPTAPAQAVIGIPAELLTRRPDIRRAERLAAAQCEQIGIAESNLYPRISITGSIGYDSQYFNQLFNSESFQGVIGPGFQWNVLNYGRLINVVRIEEAKFMELVTRYQNVVLRANAEVEDALAQYLQSQIRARDLKESVDASEKAVQLAIVQYRGGLVDFNRVALLEQNLVQQQDLYAAAVGDIALGMVNIYRALGGGWQIRCGPDGVMLASGEQPIAAEEIPPGSTKSEEVAPGKPVPSAPKSPATKPRESKPGEPTPATPPSAPPRVLPPRDAQPPAVLPPAAPPPATQPSDDDPFAPDIIHPDDLPRPPSREPIPDPAPPRSNDDVFGPRPPSSPSNEPSQPETPALDNDPFGPRTPPEGQPHKPDNLEPIDDIFGPPSLPTPPAGRSTKAEAADRGASRFGWLFSPPAPHRPPSRASTAARQASHTAPNRRSLFPGRVEHAGLLPEDRGEVRKVR